MFKSPVNKLLRLLIILGSLFILSLPAYAIVYSYNIYNRLDTVAYDNGYTLKYVYDNNGNLLKVIVNDLIAPTWPQGSALTAPTINGTNLTLSWSAAQDNQGVTSYNLYKNGTLLTTVSGSTTTYQVTGLTPDTSYTFKVEAADDAGNLTTSGPSITVTPHDSATPTWPLGSIITRDFAYTNGLTIGWTAAQDNEGVTNYKIYMNGSYLATVDGKTRSYSVNGLTLWTYYTFKVEAGDQAGNWTTNGPSATVCTTILGGDTLKPAWPDGSAIASSNVSSTSLTLTWNAAQDNVGVTGYRLYKNGTLLTTLSGSTLTYNVTGLTGNIAYTFKVEAGDQAGNWSTTGPSVNVTTPPITESVAPTWPVGSNLTSNTGNTTLTLSWGAAQDNVGVTNYSIYQDGTLIAIIPGNTLSYDITGLSAKTSYTFKVEAGDLSGNWSTAGPSITVTTLASVPTWPSGSSLTATNIQQTSLTLTWTAAQDSQGVTKYIIFNNGEERFQVDGNTLSTNVINLTPNKTCTFKVEAANSNNYYSIDGPSVTIKTAP